MAITVPADRRFLRSHVHTPRRRRLRLRPIIKVARIVAVAAVLVGSGYWVARSFNDARWLRVQHIQVVGNLRVPATEIAVLVEGLRGESVLAVDLERWRSRLLASPWVSDATLHRRLPSTIEVEIRERSPFGMARIGKELYLVDAAGTIDEFGPRYADLNLPVIDGLVRDTSSPRPAIDRVRARAVERLMADLRPHPALAQRVSQILVNDPHDVHVILDGDSAVVRLGDTSFAERLQSYVDLQATLRQRVPAIDYVDLRFGERVYVGPTHAPAVSGKRVVPSGVREPAERH